MINGKIILCQGINLDSDMINVLDYTEEQMLALCNSKQVASANNYSFIDESKGIIYCSFPYDTCLKSNYIAFQNPNYSNKWFFAFVSDVVYKGDRNTEIHFKVDSWSTWFKSLTIKPSFVVREHTNDDRVGANIVEEGLDTGTPIAIGQIIEHGFSTFGYIAVDTNWTPEYAYPNAAACCVDGVVRGYKTIFFNYNEYGLLDFYAFVYRANQLSLSDSVLSVYYIPYEVIDVQDLVTRPFTYTDVEGQTLNGKYYDYPDTWNAYSSTYNFTGNFSWSDYTPRNNKLKCYPYNYLLVTNNSGSYLTYRYEDFSGIPNFSFKFEFSATVGGSGRVVPLNYKGYQRCDDESIPLSKLPTFRMVR